MDSSESEGDKRKGRRRYSGTESEDEKGRRDDEKGRRKKDKDKKGKKNVRSADFKH